MNLRPINELKVCRLCAEHAENSKYNNIFDKANESVIQQIQELTGLKLKDMPRHTRHICTPCKHHLTDAFFFRRKIIDTQSYFSSKDYKTKLETKEEDARPKFAFVQLDEPEIDDMKSSSYDSDDQRHKAEVFIKKETIVNSKIIENNDCKTKSESHKDFSFKEEITDLSDDDFEDNFDKNEDSDDCLNSGDPDFVIKLRKPKKAQSNNLKDKAEEDAFKERQFKCHLCQSPMENLTCLKIHFRKRHKGQKFKCDLCEEKFPTIKSLVRHFRFHRGEKEFKCNYCDLMFDYLSTRVRHERRIHSTDSPFLCFICGKSFVTTHMGREHMTVHTKERAFHCSVCKTDFLRKTHLRTHYRSMTHKNNEKKFNEALSTANTIECHQNLNLQN